MKILKANYKTYIAICYDSLSVFLSICLSYFLRFNQLDLNQYKDSIFLFSFIQISCLHYFKLYRGVWRFSSTPDLLRVIKSVSLATIICTIILFFYDRLQSVPRSIFIINWFISIVSLGGGRFIYRLWKDNRKINKSENILIVGAKEGERLYREIKSSSNYHYNVIGFLDKDPQYKNRTIHGLPILGFLDNLEIQLKKHSIDKIFIATPDLKSDDLSIIIDKALPFNIEVKKIPNFIHILSGKIELSLLRKISPEDLLMREPVNLELDKLNQMIENKIVLVTGGGGSIGSEICLQISNLNPKKLIIYDLSEYFLYEIETKLREYFPSLDIIPVLGNISDKEHLEFIFDKYHPQIIFHAAAYKHVPMVEINPLITIRTNILGMKNLGDVAIKFKAEKVVIISTDKAVNPTNVMGATKRIAEIIGQNFQRNFNTTKFVIVRFGNVLGSNGSVVPRFKKQIEKGGPITVTHPDINRYFMSIPEACQLVLQAGSMGNGGEIFILEMGEPIKIVELAEQMIKLSGLRPYIDIDIQYTGLRPGEKLYEELIALNEKTIKTNHQKIKVAISETNSTHLNEKINLLISLKHDTNFSKISTLIKEIIPEFNHLNTSLNEEEDHQHLH